MGVLFDNKQLDDIRELLQDLDEFAGGLPRRFNRVQFRRVRRQTGTQYEWAEATGVTQTTIGNWERGFTIPNQRYRIQLRDASNAFSHNVIRAFSRPASGDTTSIDVRQAERGLRSSILRAALTDFEFNPVTSQIIPVPFRGDYDPNVPSEIEEDRVNLLQSLGSYAATILESLNVESQNLNQRKFSTYLKSYADEAQSEAPNPRLLNRLGATISRITNSDDFQGAVNDWDTVAVEGFNADHIELMRLYFREALARAQEVDAAQVESVINQSDGREFRDVADIMDSAATTDGQLIIEQSVPTLLRDIADEIREYDEAAKFSTDPDRRRILERRKSEAFKNGGIYVGRFVFFSALISSLALPGVVEIVSVLSGVVGITETVAPGTVRRQYELLRDKFPALPALPEKGPDADD